eukprot:522170-Amphidinium_carterae.2
MQTQASFPHTLEKKHRHAHAHAHADTEKHYDLASRINYIPTAQTQAKVEVCMRGTWSKT